MPPAKKTQQNLGRAGVNGSQETETKRSTHQAKHDVLPKIAKKSRIPSWTSEFSGRRLLSTDDYIILRSCNCDYQELENKVESRAEKDSSVIAAKTRSNVAPWIAARKVYDLARVTDRGAVRTLVKQRRRCWRRHRNKSESENVNDREREKVRCDD